MNRIVIVRHGNTFAPDETPRRIGRRTDLPLVPSGIAQGEALGRWFADAGFRFARALAGPLQRTRETAALILAATRDPAPLEIADWLAEVDHGPDEGQPEPAVVARIGEDALAAWDRAATPPDGWTVDAVARRRAWRRLFAAPPAGDMLLVTSNGAARFALLARPALRLPGSMKLRTGAFGEILCGGSTYGAVTLTRWDVRPGDPQAAG